jgi:peroxiredoxin
MKKSNPMKEIILATFITSMLILTACANPTPNTDAISKAQQAIANDNTVRHENLFEVTEGVDVGNSLPNFKIATVDGTEVSLSDYKNKKPVLLYFMATWCPYCRQDFTSLSPIFKNYKDDVEILAVSLDLSEDANILKQYRANFPSLTSLKFAPGNGDILANYQVRTTTTKYAIKKDGTLLYKGSGAFKTNQWTTLLEELKNA